MVGLMVWLVSNGIARVVCFGWVVFGCGIVKVFLWDSLG